MMVSAKVLLEKVELAQLANGGKELREDWCTCDPSVGMAPCQYCAMQDALEYMEKYLREQIAKEAEETEHKRRRVREEYSSRERGPDGY